YDGAVRAPWLLSVATAFVLLGASIAAFLNPVWVGFEQARVGSAQLVGTCESTVTGMTNQILAELILGGSFEDVRPPNDSSARCRVSSSGDLALAPAEASHMRDVRGVFAGFGLLVLVSLVWVVVTWRRSRADRTAWWRAVRTGAAGLAVVLAALGAISLVAFDAAFEVFHELFFAKGTYSFDPATSRLIQLFPDQFWSDTTLALGAFAIILALATAWLATRRIAAAPGMPARTGATLPVGRAARP
ncbi:MAG TPA: DUF1461 domain-containing protein, partial [Candidatus Limnocylindrales bacterium]